VNCVTFAGVRAAAAAGYNEARRSPGATTPKKNSVSMELNEPKQPAPGAAVAERRRGERRSQLLRSLIYGSLRPRRRGPRRLNEEISSAVDWHHPQWLAISMLIVIGSGTDALLTLVLIEHGVAVEANPVMAPLVGHSALAFALTKVLLTAAGVVLLVKVARMRAFGRIPVGAFLYLVLAIYGALIAYEITLLNMI
jgi:hypothetical protein